MCLLCKEVLSLHDAGETDKALRSIAHAILDGKKAEHFKKVEDAILGTKETKTDDDLDEAWERSRR